MTTDLVKAIQAAYQSPEDQRVINAAHTCFLSSTLVMPIEKAGSSEDEPTPLFLHEGGVNYLPVFSHLTYLEAWANDSLIHINTLAIVGKDIVKGAGANTVVCLDIGTAHYKEFSLDELQRLRSVVNKLEKIISRNSG